MRDHSSKQNMGRARWNIWIVVLALGALLTATLAPIASFLGELSGRERNIIPLVYGESRETVQADGLSYFRAGESAGPEEQEGEAAWKIEAKVDLFKAAYSNGQGRVTVKSAAGDKIIAPGTSCEYEFKLKNTNAESMEYTMRLSSGTSPERKLPIQVRLRSGDRWILGGADSWAPHEALSGAKETGAVSEQDKYVTYTLEWQWPYESGAGDALPQADANDTQAGNEAVTQTEEFWLKIEVLTTLDEETDPPVKPTPTPTAKPTPTPTAKPTPTPTAKPTPTPTVDPGSDPDDEPDPKPTPKPTVAPSTEPTAGPSSQPGTEPTAGPSSQPGTEPTVGPSPEPGTEPTVEPSPEQTIEPPVDPVAKPTLEPSSEPTSEPAPAPGPTVKPVHRPSPEPTVEATAKPVIGPIIEPSPEPTSRPSPEPPPGPDEEPPAPQSPWGFLPWLLLLGLLGIFLLLLLLFWRTPVYVTGFLPGEGELKLGRKKDALRSDGRFVFPKIYMGKHSLTLDPAQCRIRLKRVRDLSGIAFESKDDVLVVSIGKEVKAIELYLLPDLTVRQDEWAAIDKDHNVITPAGVKEPDENEENVTPGGLHIDKDGKLDMVELAAVK